MSTQPERLGRYRLLERLGQGGMATVYRAQDEELHRAVAIKLMHPFLAASKEAAGRFQREARAVAALRHPNVLQVHDYAPEEGERPAYLVTELISGPTLKKFLEQHGAPLPEVAAMVGVKLARALGAAHAQAIVHRDVKPENVMVDAGGRIVLCDFGIARLSAVESTMTATGAVIGSPAYMSPEQAAGEELDHRSDLFSLGTVLYLVATGALPFHAKEPLVLLAKIHRGDHLPPTAKNARVPPYLERAIERCLKVSPEARFQSGDEVAAALEAGLRADGLGEVDRELSAYFADPPVYNAAAEPRIVASSIDQARAAAKQGEVSRALALCNRVLAWRPDDEAARALVARLGRSDRLRRWAAISAAVAVVGLAVSGGALWYKSVPRLPTATQPAPAIASRTSPTAPAPATPTPTPKFDAPTVDPARTAKLGAMPQVAAARATPTHAVAPHHGAPPPRAPAVEPQSAVPLAPVVPPLPAPVAPVADGDLQISVKPYCDRPSVDGKAVVTGRPIGLAPGPHQVHCEYQGRALDREVIIAPGGHAELRHSFVADDAVVEIHLTRGDAITVDGGPRWASGREARVPVGEHREVRLFKLGRPIDRGLLDIPPGRCLLRDDPLECRKP